MSHTPLPWSAMKSSIGSAWVIRGKDEFPIVMTMGNNTTEGMKRHKNGTHQADAEFIVRAVNAHDDMVAALKGMVAFYEGRKYNDPAAHDAAIAALAKAEAA